MTFGVNSRTIDGGGDTAAVVVSAGDRMKILFVAARYLPLLGGIETHIDEVGRRMAVAGHRVHILTTDLRGDLPAQEDRDGMTIQRVKAYPVNRDYYFSPRIGLEIGQKGSDFDIIHFQGYHTFVPVLGMTAAARRKYPYVVTFHSGGHPSAIRNSIRGLQQRALAPLVRRAAAVVAVSQFEADMMAVSMRLDPLRITVIRNGATLPPPGDPEPITDPNLILSIGRLERYKGHHRAIEALPHLPSQTRLKVVGSGPYEGQLRARVKALSLDDRVEFISVPPTERQQFSRLLHTAGLVVLLSDYEANPVVVMEALGARRRVLVGYTSGCRELADMGWCRSVPIPSDPAAIAGAIVASLQSHQVASIQVPSWDDCTRELLSVYESVVKEVQWYRSHHSIRSDS